MKGVHWCAFRQQRLTMLGALAVLIALAVVAANEHASMLGFIARRGLAACMAQDDGCDLRGGYDFQFEYHYFFKLSQGLMLVLPALIGAFWGAPLVAPEIETGTIRLALTQSVGRGRWIYSKVLFAVVGVAVVMSGATALAMWIVNASGRLMAPSRISPIDFDTTGVVPVCSTA